jgi:hypothetical protein
MTKGATLTHARPLFYGLRWRSASQSFHNSCRHISNRLQPAPSFGGAVVTAGASRTSSSASRPPSLIQFNHLAHVKALLIRLVHSVAGSEINEKAFQNVGKVFLAASRAGTAPPFCMAFARFRICAPTSTTRFVKSSHHWRG